MCEKRLAREFRAGHGGRFCCCRRMSWLVQEYEKCPVAARVVECVSVATITTLQQSWPTVAAAYKLLSIIPDFFVPTVEAQDSNY